MKKERLIVLTMLFLNCAIVSWLFAPLAGFFVMFAYFTGFFDRDDMS